MRVRSQRAFRVSFVIAVNVVSRLYAWQLIPCTAPPRPRRLAAVVGHTNFNSVWLLADASDHNTGGSNSGINQDGEGNGSASMKEPDVANPISDAKSPLAMAAADWMNEQDEEDEWTQYWQRFQDGKQHGEKPKHVQMTTDGDLTTAERLEQNLLRRGIDHKQQTQMEPELQRVLQQCAHIEDAEQVVQTLAVMEPLVSTNTLLGGTFYLEWATAFWQTNNNERSLQTCRELIQNNPHRDIITRAKRLAQHISSGKSPPTRKGQDEFNTFQWDDVSTW